MSYEVRVWHEDGTLMGAAEVVDGRYSEYSEVDPRSGYAWQRMPHLSAEVAEIYIREWAEAFAEYCREQCDCDWVMYGTCGVLDEHGISIQHCRDGYTVNPWG